MNFPVNFKNIWATLLFCVITVSLFAQQSQEFTLKGTLINSSEIHNDIYITYPQFLHKKLEHAVIKNNQYEFKGTIEEPTGLILSFDAKPTLNNYITIIVSPGEMKITTSAGLKDIIASGNGAKAQNEFNLSLIHI